ncbi:MAG: cation-translocating P-type ATPase [Pirellulaceae bacterium]
MSSPAAKDVCHYCGLPTPSRSWFGARAHAAVETEPAGPVYCCSGCRFAEAVAQERGAEGQARWTLTRLGLAVFFSMTVMVFTLALWTQDVYLSEGEIPPQAGALYDLFRYICLLFALPVLMLLGAPLLESVIADLRRLRPTTDVLLLMGVAAAFVYSLASVLRGQGHVYFEVVCMVLVAVTLGRWFEATGRLKTTEALHALERLLPDVARVVRDGCDMEIPTEEIVVGDQVRVAPGERIAADGVIVRNRATIDQQAVTGESQPAIREEGDAVLSGTLNLDGDILLRATAPGTAGTLKSMAEAVASAAACKERYQRLADRVVRWFLPVVVVLALTALAVHWRWSGLDHGLLAALAVVLIACPCALALATPMALWASLGRASRGQVLVREGDALSRLAQARVLCFDKTGTLTTGRPKLTRLVCDPAASETLVKQAAATLADSSRHELSQAVVRSNRDLQPTSAARDVLEQAGRGISGFVSGVEHRVYLGSPRYMQENDQIFSPEIQRQRDQAEQEALSLCCVAWDGAVQGVFCFREQLRDEAADVLDWCRGRYHVVVLTGDHRARAEALSRELRGVAIEAEMLPGDKLAAVERLRREHGAVVMIGDGVNDAPALAAADVGLALGSGADISRHSGDVCLLSSKLDRLPWLIALSQRTVRVIRWNLLWALLYNSVGVALAAAGLLNPIVAAAAMAISSLLVVSNSLRLAGLTDEDLLRLVDAQQLLVHDEAGRDRAASIDDPAESRAESRHGADELDELAATVAGGITR